MKSARVLIIFTMITALLVAVAGCTSGDSDEADETVDITFIEFFDPKCPFCAEMEPIVEDLRAEYEPRISSFEIIDVTTPDGKDKVEEFGVFLTPTFVILDGDGEELDRINGAAPEETMLEFMDRAIADVTGEGGGGPRESFEGEGSAVDE